MPEGEKHLGASSNEIDRDNLPSQVQIGLTDLPNIGGASGPPGPPVPASLIPHLFGPKKLLKKYVPRCVEIKIMDISNSFQMSSLFTDRHKF